MTQGEISQFFKRLCRNFDGSCQIILTGAALGSIYGGIRATLDIDFALKFKKVSKAKKQKLWDQFSEAIARTSAETGVAVQYAEDIDRWSSITFLDYEKHTELFKRFGKIEVRLLDPPYWAIGKLARYLDPDIRDLIQVLKAAKTRWQDLTKVLGLALKKSPKSTACFLFRKQVEDFLKSYGRKIWGSRFKAEESISRFHRFAALHKQVVG